MSIAHTALLCLQAAIYHEARGEPLDGQLYVAHVIMNRVESSYYPDDVCAVVHQAHQFSFDKSAPMADEVSKARAKSIAEAVMGRSDVPPVIKGVTHYHAVRVSPSWAKSMDPAITEGHHTFYRAPRGCSLKNNCSLPPMMRPQ